MKKLLKEFGDFIKRGNVLDLAVAVVIGSAFTGIVTSIVEYLINPETIEILENSDLSPEEKSLYYNMKTKYNFVNDSQISVEYQNIITNGLKKTPVVPQLKSMKNISKTRA